MSQNPQSQNMAGLLDSLGVKPSEVMDKTVNFLKASDFKEPRLFKFGGSMPEEVEIPPDKSKGETSPTFKKVWYMTLIDEKRQSHMLAESRQLMRLRTTKALEVGDYVAMQLTETVDTPKGPVNRWAVKVVKAASIPKGKGW